MTKERILGYQRISRDSIELSPSEYESSSWTPLPFKGKSYSSRLPIIVIIIQAIVIFNLGAKIYIEQHDRARRRSTTTYSPAENAIQLQSKVFNVSFIGTARSHFLIPPSDELDGMWNELTKYSISRVPKNQADLFVNETAAIPGDEGYYLAELEVFHQLHCLNVIRQALHADYYPEMTLSDITNVRHVDHCVDSIRQSLMCSGDITPLVWQWEDTPGKVVLKGDVPHTCIDFDALLDWGRKHQYHIKASGPRSLHSYHVLRFE